MAQAISQQFGQHGGRIDEARATYPDAPTPWIDLSTGINPNPWPPAFELHPDSEPLPMLSDLRALEAAAARYFGVEADRVAAVPGSEIALRLLPVLGLPRPIVAHRPSYGTHIEIADQAVTADRPISSAGTHLIANPNNPDGNLTTPAKMHGLQHGWLVVDEAFADATPEASILPVTTRDAPVIVTRSFGKFFGLAGVRLGFVIAPPAILAALRCLLGDWPVSAQAIGWGTTAYADTYWIEATRIDLRERARTLDRLLARHGFTATGACPLFRLIEHPDAATLFDRLAQAGILTRPFADRSDWLRLGLPSNDAAFDRLDRALARA